jgi:SAM-dependent methyltransferase
LLSSFESVSSCPLCGSVRLGHLDEAFHFDHCASCGFVFDNPRPTLAAIAEHYSRAGQYDDWLAHIDAREAMWKRRLRKMLHWVKKGSLLDVGTGIGQFLSLARPHFSQVYGTELSESAIRTAKERYDLDIFHGTIESLPHGGYDNLTLIHVLEHVPSPHDTLRRCFELLNPGGRLFLCVPNDIRSWTSRLRALRARLRSGSNSRVIGLPRCGTTNEIHLSHFTAATLSSGVRQAGFQVLDVGTDPVYAATGVRLAAYHLNYWVHTIMRLPTYQALWLVAARP